MTQPPQPDLDRYLDGLMTEDEMLTFRSRMAEDATLAADVERQGMIDATLGRMAQPNDAHLEACLAGCLQENRDDEPISFEGHASAKQAAPNKRPWWVRYGAIAALIALAGIAAQLWFLSPEPQYQPPRYQSSRYAEPQTVVIAGVYASALAEGFKPEWVCETDQQFRDTFRNRLGQEVSLSELPPDRVALGLSYLPRARESTVFLLAEAQGQPILVFADRGDMLHHYELAPPEGMHLHRKSAGSLELLELSPLSEPMLLDYLVVIESQTPN
ncbi:MAG: hypothetical protein AAGE65_06505 [Planctomycetota bacterium]